MDLPMIGPGSGADLPAVLEWYARQPRQWRRRIFLICSSQSEAGRMQTEEATSYLLQLGAVPQYPGSSMWSLNGHLVQFISAQGQIGRWMQQLRGGAVIVLCDEADFGEYWEYTVNLFRHLHQHRLAWVMIPTKNSQPDS